jgi:3'-5' exoribonuclease
MLGSATLTIVMSSRSMKVAVQTTISVHHLRSTAVDRSAKRVPIGPLGVAAPRVSPRPPATRAAASKTRYVRPALYRQRPMQPASSRSVEQMECDLRELIATVQSPYLKLLLAEILAEGSHTGAAYRAAPAAKHYHQAYRHGLLEHCLTVAQAVGAIAATFPGIDRDVAVTGALLHDIGKIEAYETCQDMIEMSDAGRLQGEIALGYYRIRRAIEQLEGFPSELEQALLHIILSHHGALQNGSPVVPCTREATLVHMIDNLGSKLGSFDRLQAELADGAHWSTFDKVIGASAFFGATDAALSAGDGGARAAAA